MGQPQVIGEMLAGILLGRSVFAILWPDGFNALFPTSSMTALYFLSQIGLIFFMFVICINYNRVKSTEYRVQSTDDAI
jgi:Kef-type K+ transport system membrane component KefB